MNIKEEKLKKRTEKEKKNKDYLVIKINWLLDQQVYGIWMEFIE